MIFAIRDTDRPCKQLSGGYEILVSREVCECMSGLGIDYMGSDDGSGQADREGGFEVYPNPFNPHTEIAYISSIPGHVLLSVYDVSGKRISTLVDQKMAAGRHKVVWHGADDEGRRVSSGSYFIRLETRSGVATKKMLLAK